MIRITIYSLLALLLMGCHSPAEVQTPSGWKQAVDEQLPLLGHRNWVLVVDKAFPAQNSDGIKIVNSGESLFTVLEYVLEQTEAATHITPVIYTDRELAYLSPDWIPGIEDYRERLHARLGKYDVQTLLHDEVFVKIDEASQLFSILVIKTEEIIPYSSVFLELDCAYWTPDQEARLRERMAQQN